MYFTLKSELHSEFISTVNILLLHFTKGSICQKFYSCTRRVTAGNYDIPLLPLQALFGRFHESPSKNLHFINSSASTCLRLSSPAKFFYMRKQLKTKDTSIF
uniref:Uncharacterized protein n=1 Tax=Lygus hesperus TaxID=30085 RepID=A0A0K8S4L6_LYGHE